MFITFDLVIPLGNSTPRNIFNKGNKALCGKDVCCNVIYDRKPNGSAKEGELENDCTPTWESIMGPSNYEVTTWEASP